MQQLNNFTRWSVNQKISFAGVRPQPQSSGGNGLFATYPLSPGTKLVQVPKQTTLTANKEGEPVPKGASVELQRVWEQLPWYGKMASKLLLLPIPEFAPYLSILPKDPSLPASWALDDVEQLQCEYMIEKVEQERQEWRQLAALLGPWLTSKAISEEQFFWALATVRNRAFAGPQFSVPFPVTLGIFVFLQALSACGALEFFGAPFPWQATEALAFVIPSALVAWDVKSAQTKVTYTIAPFLDMLNHSSRVKAEVGYDFVKEAYSVSSCRSYARGEEVLISYGELSNDACLQLFGFAEVENPHDRYVFQDLGRRLLQGPLGQKAGAGAAKFLQQSIADAKGLLTQVPVTANGFPPEVTQFVQRIAAELTDISPVGNSADLTQRALRDACKKELQLGFATTLDADLAELDELELQVSKYKLEKMLIETGQTLPERTPPTEAGLSEQGDSARGLNSADSPSAAADRLDIPPAQEQSSSASAPADMQGQAEATAPHQDAGMTALTEDSPAVGSRGAASNTEDMVGANEEGVNVPSTPPSAGSPKPALPDIDLDQVARHKTWLIYRIQKKRLLASILMPIREVRFS